MIGQNRIKNPIWINGKKIYLKKYYYPIMAKKKGALDTSNISSPILNYLYFDGKF